MSGRDRTLDEMGYAEALRAARKLPASPVGAPDRRTISIMLAGNCSVDFMIPGLRVAMHEHGFDATVATAAFDGWVQDALAGSCPADVWLIWVSTMGASQGLSSYSDVNWPALQDAITSLRNQGTIVVLIPPEPTSLEVDPFSSFSNWRRRQVSLLQALIDPGVICWQLDGLVAQIGSGRWGPGRYWSSARMPCHPNSMTTVGRWAARIVVQALLPSIKAVVVDLDDTIWGGLVGEVGASGIDLDPFGTGAPYLALQRYLKDLQGQGIALAVASKNSPANAREPFASRSEMVLTLDDFVALHAGWDAKHQAVQAVASQLNIASDSVCFIDDSPSERTEMRALLPDVVVPELPADPEERVAFLVGSGLFVKPRRSNEDVARVEMFKVEGRRQARRSRFDTLDAYLASLDMTIVAHPVLGPYLDRSVDLIAKTNQFNVTNRRRSKKELVETLRSGKGAAFCIELSDRFGKSGIVGVLIADGTLPGVFAIDTWVLSCRVFGRGVEFAMFDVLVSAAAAAQVASLRSRYVLSSKNAVIARLHDSLGFVLVAEDELGRDYVAHLPTAVPRHFISVESASALPLADVGHGRAATA